MSKPTKQELIDHIESLVAKCAELTRERDEARREVCMNEANHLPTMADPHREAKRRGWDCFKKDSNGTE
jgi:hypothetical protein